MAYGSCSPNDGRKGGWEEGRMGVLEDEWQMNELIKSCEVKKWGYELSVLASLG